MIAVEKVRILYSLRFPRKTSYSCPFAYDRSFFCYVKDMAFFTVKRFVLVTAVLTPEYDCKTHWSGRSVSKALRTYNLLNLDDFDNLLWNQTANAHPGLQIFQCNHA